MGKAAVIVMACLLSVIAEARQFTGRVMCGKRGVAGVVVSDGVNTAVTGKYGTYVLEAGADGRYVFISTPAGYSSPSGSGVPLFWLPVEDGCDTYDFTLEKRRGDDSVHAVVVTADPQVYDRTEFPELERAVSDISGTVSEMDGRYVFGICCGDITFHDHGLYGDINRIMSGSGIEFRNVMGNHDMKVWGRSYETSFSEYGKVYGPEYYSFNVGKVHYVMLDDCFFIGRDYFYIGYLDERQLRWLENDLSHVPEGANVVVSMHIPSTLSAADRERFSYGDIFDVLSNKKALYDILAPYKVNILSGHIHTASNQQISGNIFEHNIPALSGAWWCGPLCTDGTPAGYKVLLADGDDISWYYKPVGMSRAEQMRVYGAEEADGIGGYVLANVWDYDPQWRITYYEDGQEVCDMEQYPSVDPEAAGMYGDPQSLKHKWISPSVTPHVFRARIKDRSAIREVRITDRFGRVYRKEL